VPFAVASWPCLGSRSSGGGLSRPAGVRWDSWERPLSDMFDEVDCVIVIEGGRLELDGDVISRLTKFALALHECDATGPCGLRY
jgi:hypothetical protein